MLTIIWVTFDISNKKFLNLCHNPKGHKLRGINYYSDLNEQNTLLANKETHFNVKQLKFPLLVITQLESIKIFWL